MDTNLTASINVQLFMDGEALTADRMNEMVRALDRLAARTQDAPASGVALAATALAAAGSRRQFTRRSFLRCGR